MIPMQLKMRVSPHRGRPFRLWLPLFLLWLLLLPLAVLLFPVFMVWVLARRRLNPLRVSWALLLMTGKLSGTHIEVVNRSGSILIQLV